MSAPPNEDGTWRVVSHTGHSEKEKPPVTFWKKEKKAVDASSASHTTTSSSSALKQPHSSTANPTAVVHDGSKVGFWSKQGRHDRAASKDMNWRTKKEREAEDKDKSPSIHSHPAHPPGFSPTPHHKGPITNPSNTPSTQRILPHTVSEHECGSDNEEEEEEEKGNVKNRTRLNLRPLLDASDKRCSDTDVNRTANNNNNNTKKKKKNSKEEKEVVREVLEELPPIPSPPSLPSSIVANQIEVVNRGKTSLKLEWASILPDIRSFLPTRSIDPVKEEKKSDSLRERETKQWNAYLEKTIQVWPTFSEMFKLEMATVGDEEEEEEEEEEREEEKREKKKKERERERGSEEEEEEDENNSNSQYKNLPFEIIYEGNSTSTGIKKLKAGREYAFRLTATLIQTPRSFPGEDARPPLSLSSLPTSPVSFFCAPSVPRQPRSPLLHSSSSTSLTLRWVPPKDSGSPISSYTLEVAEGEERFRPIYSGEDTGYTIKKLQPATTYRVRVKAENRVGYSAFSIPLECETQPDAPECPGAPELIGKSGVKAVAKGVSSSTNLNLRWSPPVDSHGLEVSEYVLEMREESDMKTLREKEKRRLKEKEKGKGEKGEEKEEDGERFRVVYRGSASTYRVVGLIPFTSYDLRVMAINKVGSSPYSSISSFRTPPSVPEICDIPTIEEVSESGLHIKWKKPHDNGSPIHTYSLEMVELGPVLSSDDRRHIEVPSLSIFEQLAECIKPEFQVSGLQPSHAYAFRVRASNKLGHGGFSDVVIRVTSASLPECVEDMWADHVTHNSFLLGWSAPHDNGSVISQYKIHIHCLTSPDKGTVGKQWTLSHKCGGTSGTATKFKKKISSLSPFSAYEVCIQACNAVGEGEMGDVQIEVATNLAPPLPPPLPNTDGVTRSTIDLSWSVGGEKNEMGADGNLVQYRVEMGVSALNHLSSSSSSTSSSSSLSSPSSSSSSSSKGKKKGKDNRTIVVEAGREEIYQVVYLGTSKQCHISGLESGILYDFRLTAINTAGETSCGSEISVRTTGSVPSSPLSLSFSQVTGSSVLVTWDPATSKGVPVLRYILDYRSIDNKSYKRGHAGIQQQRTLKDLSPFTEYEVRVVAVNAAGQGPFISGIFSTTGSPPSPPTSVSVSRLDKEGESSFISIQWKQKEKKIIRHIVEKRDMAKGERSPYFEVYRGTEMSTLLPLKSVETSQRYHFRVRSENSFGVGKASKGVQFEIVVDEEERERERERELQKERERDGNSSSSSSSLSLSPAFVVAVGVVIVAVVAYFVLVQ